MWIAHGELACVRSKLEYTGTFGRMLRSIGSTTSSVIAKRRTVRKFTDVPMPEEDLMKILNAAWMAPSSGNWQLWASP